MIPIHMNACNINDFQLLRAGTPRATQGAVPLMDTEVLPDELERAVAKFDANETRTAERMSFGDTTAALGITKKYLSIVTDHLKSKLEDQLKSPSSETPKVFIKLVNNLSHEVIALCCLQTVLHSVGKQETVRETIELLGLNISGECFAAKLTETKPKLMERIDSSVRLRTGNLDQRLSAARKMAQAGGFSYREWSRYSTLRAGEWLLNVVLEACPDVFQRVSETKLERGKVFEEVSIYLTEGGQALADSIVSETILRNPVYLPTITPPKPWTGWNEGGVNDERMNRVTFLRSPYKDTAAAVRHAIKVGSMQPALDGVNALQSVPWVINTRMLEVLDACKAMGVTVKGLPPKEDLPRMHKPINWAKLDDAQQKLWKHRAEETHKANRTYGCDRLLLTLDLATAWRMSCSERFYTAMNCDWRGRVYPLPHFNFQRDDRVRALFLFADGEPIGEEGLRWLKVHVANCGDFDKISKRPLQERVEWTENFASHVTLCSHSPMRGSALAVWTKADKPFLFLAACMELTAALKAGPQYITRLPVSFDGSCSGLQHLCAMTRAAEGSRVNLTPNAEPQDVYQAVADIVNERISSDDSELAGLARDFGIDRKVVKRNVMTYSYSSRKFGMSQQQDEDLIVPLQLEVTAGKRKEHPFLYFASKKHADAPSAAGRFLAKHVFTAIEEVVQKPAQAMKFLQALARAMAHEGKPLSWTTPTGIPWINRYHESIVTKVRLWLHDSGVKSPHYVRLAEGHKNEIDKDKAANGVAPNFVHALDAAHLLLVAGAASREGMVQLATVHDSFGCLASRATRFNQIIREEFVRMYQGHDVLEEVLASATHDLTQANWNKLPVIPERGPLNINEVLNADFAFA